MTTTTKLYKSTIVIWSDFDPAEVELSALAWEAEQGSAICTRFDPVEVTDPDADTDYPVEFFSSFLDDDDDDEVE